jgi:serine/threonine protein phosphatase 1
VVPQNHSVFLENAALWIERGNLLFVHAGIKPRVSLDAQTEDDLIWIRDPFLNYTKPHPWLVVHGHTALEHPAHFGNRIDLDGGAGFGHPIHPAVFEGDQCWLLKEKGRVELIA